jgi:outer membrane protein
MKHFSIVSIFLASVLASAAQTNTEVVATNAEPVVASTNSEVVATNAGMADLTADVDTNAPQQAMSLQDCFQEALTHNFDVQIERYNPKISLYALNAAYAGYDPLLNFSATHQHDEEGVDNIPPDTTSGDSFSSGVNGSLPWGTTYDLSGTISDTYGNGFNGFRFIGPTNGALFSPGGSSVGSVQLSVTQPLLKNFWIDTTRLTIRVAKSQLKSSEQGLRSQIINTITAVENAYYELIFAQEDVEVETQALVLAQTQLDQDKQRVQVGSLAPLDVQQDEAQVAQSRANLIAAENTLSVDQNALKNLITDSYPQWHGTNIQPTATLEAPLELFDLQDSWSKGMTERPDLLQARYAVEQQGIRLKFSYNQIFPELDLVGTYGFNGTAGGLPGTFNQFREGDRPFYSYGVQLSVPLSNVGPRSQYKSAKATMQQVVLQLKQLEQSVMVGIDNAVNQARSDYESVDATRQARIYAAAALDAEQKKYAVGKSTTFTVLQLQNNLTAARSQEIRALANYNQALANLAQQEGSTLERNDVDIEAK